VHIIIHNGTVLSRTVSAERLAAQFVPPNSPLRAQDWTNALKNAEKSNRLVVDQSEWRFQMLEVGSYEAKTHLPRLLERVAKGERITITKHGVPVAILIPVGGRQTGSADETVEQLRLFRQGRKRGSISLRRMIEEGRR